jgi:hypothetical protein
MLTIRLPISPHFIIFTIFCEEHKNTKLLGVSEIMDIVCDPRIIFHNASQTGSASVFRWNGERGEPKLMVNEFSLALSNGPNEIGFPPFCFDLRGRQIKPLKFHKPFSLIGWTLPKISLPNMTTEYFKAEL